MQFYKKIIFIIVLFLFYNKTEAQLPICSGVGSGLIYYVDAGQIYNLDPAQPLSATNPSANTLPAMPSFAGALAVCRNLNAAGPSPTFYTTDGSFYYYYNGTSWINTGHSPGNSAAVNIGGGTNYIYSLVGGTGQVYRYDGTSNATLLTTVATFNGGGPYDIVVDCSDNFYLLNTTLQTMEEYNSSGVLIKTYTTNSPISSAGGGFAIIGNTVYYDNTSGYVSGPIVGNTINFTVIDPNGLTPSPSDFASCIFGSGNSSSLHDTFFTCANSSPVQLQAADNAPYNWSIINGSGTINGTGQNVSIAPTSNVAVVVNDSTLCGTGSDTFSIFVPTATINLSYPSSTTLPCNTKTTSLTVTVGNNIDNTNFSSSWTPTNAIINGINTLQPIINLDLAVNYTLTLTAPVNQAGCTITKSFHFDFSACDTVTIKFPNAFSPSIDGVNANFHPLGNVKHVTYLDFRIYNRWGQEVYASNDALKGWDGNFLDKPSPQDVYVYSAVYKVVGDVDYRHITGNVTLLR